MGTVHGPVAASTFHTGAIRPNTVSLWTFPSVMRPTTGTTFEGGGEFSRLELSAQPHYLSSLEKRLELAFDGDSQGNVVHSHTGCNFDVTEFGYGIVCLRPYPQDFEFIGDETVVLIGRSESN